jgi:hypothetical protein
LGPGNESSYTQAQAYYPLYQIPDQWVTGSEGFPTTTIIVRTPLPAAAVIPAIKNVLYGMGKDQPIWRCFWRQSEFTVKQTPNEYRFMGGEPGEVWVTDLKSGRSESLVPGFEATDYDLSADGRQVVLEAADPGGTPLFWVAAFDRQSPPRPIPNVHGRTPRFGPSGEIFFRTSGIIYSVRPDGTGLRKVFSQETLLPFGVSRDGRWITAWPPVSDSAVGQAFPLRGGVPVPIGNIVLHWSPDGRSLSLSGNAILGGRSYIVPLPTGQALPRIPANGFSSEEEVAGLPGAHRIDEVGVVPGPSPGVYAFYRGTAPQRNLYRIPIL